MRMPTTGLPTSTVRESDGRDDRSMRIDLEMRKRVTYMFRRLNEAGASRVRWLAMTGALALLFTGGAAVVGAGCSFLIPIRKRRSGVGV